MQVVAREMDRAGRYLFVLLLVWVPNFLANLVQQAGSGFSVDGGDDQDDEQLDGDVGYFVEVRLTCFAVPVAWRWRFL
jgi:hypothetical protein